MSAENPLEQASAGAQPRRWAVVGGGMLGLTIALRCAQSGGRVTVFEGAQTLGGLAAPWSMAVEAGPDVVWDRHYHVTLLSDRHVRALLDEIGVGAQIRWVQTRTGYYAGGRLSPVSNTVDFLRLPSLGPIAKARLAVTILHGSRVKNWRALENMRVQDWLTRWSGRATFDRFWRPLLRAKLGDAYRESNAAFIWATIQRLYAARRTGLKKEMFGYVPGGYARTLACLADVLADSGVEIRTGVAVDRVASRVDGALTVQTACGAGAPEAPIGEVLGEERGEVFDEVVVTTTGRIASRMCPELSPQEHALLDAIRYQGIVCASVLLDRPLSEYYLTYLLDEMPFTAVVEMTAFVDRAETGGYCLVYLPRYAAPDDPLFERSDADIEAEFLDALGRMYEGFSPSHVKAFRVSRVRAVFPLPVLGYSRLLPARHTSVAGLHLVSSAQIVNGTLNVDETVGLAEAAARELIESAGGGAGNPAGGAPKRAARELAPEARWGGSGAVGMTVPTIPERGAT